MMTPRGRAAADVYEEQSLTFSPTSGRADCSSDLLHGPFGLLERIQADFTRRIDAAAPPMRQP